MSIRTHDRQGKATRSSLREKRRVFLIPEGYVALLDSFALPFETTICTSLYIGKLTHIAIGAATAATSALPYLS